MAFSELRIEDKRLMFGCSAGLAEPTALVEIAYTGSLDAAAEERMRAEVADLCPQEPFFGLSEADWPSAFLAEEGDGDESDRLGAWVIALTVALQLWARDPVFAGRVRSSAPGRVRVAIPWRRERIFGDAVGLALRLVGHWSAPEPDPAAFQDLLHYFQGGLPSARGALSYNNLRYIQAARDRDIPFEVLPHCVQLGWGSAAERLDSGITGRTGFIGVATSSSKAATSRLLAQAGLPVPRGAMVEDLDQAVRAANELGWPVVVKPVRGNKGTGVTPGVRDVDTLRRAFETAAAMTGTVVVESHIDGDDHRLLVVNGRLLAAARRIPGGVTGDGSRTVRELLDRLNADPRRVKDTVGLLSPIALDAEAHSCLAEQDLSAGSVPESGRWVPLRRTANISTGGTGQDVGTVIHPDNRRLAERAARTAGLDITGVDFLTRDISRSWRDVGGAICEVNTQPALTPHWDADPGRDINGEIIDILFAGRSGRIPVAAVSGTNGKSTTCTMLHHIWMTAGRRAGLSTTASVRVGNTIIGTDDITGIPGTKRLLKDPAVEAAVLEIQGWGMLHEGHPCDRYDVAALLNVQNDHLGLDGIETREQMADIKAEVLERARDAVVVNADDPNCMRVRARAGTDRHILVTRDPSIPAVREHRRGGGEAVFPAVHEGQTWIVLATGEAETPLLPVGEIPATMGGLVRVNVTNAMFASALAWAQGIDLDIILRALRTFRATVEQNPGRYNLVEGFSFQVLLDYAHNPDGIEELCRVAVALPVAGRRIVCSLNIGNRHADHVPVVAPMLAAVFEQLVLGADPKWISTSVDHGGDDPVAAMLDTTRQGLLDNGFDESRITTAANPEDAIRATLALARPGDLVVILAEPYDALPVLQAAIREGRGANRA